MSMTRTEAHRSWHRSSILAVALLAGTLAACSSGGSSTTTSSSSSPGSTVAPPSAAESRTEIDHAYAVLFNLANPAVAPKLAVVQDGTALRAAITAALKSTLAKSAAGAKVTKITVLNGSACTSESLSSPCAKVTYNIVGPSGKVLLSKSVGFAVYQSPSWKVSKTTICTLLTLAGGGTAPSGC